MSLFLENLRAPLRAGDVPSLQHPGQGLAPVVLGELQDGTTQMGPSQNTLPLVVLHRYRYYCNNDISIIIVKIFFPSALLTTHTLIVLFFSLRSSPGTGLKRCVRYCHCFQISSLLMSKIIFVVNYFLVQDQLSI